jgi:hypothetical protein
VVQRQRLLAYNQTTTVRVRPGLLKQFAQVRQLAERLGLNPSVCGFDSRLGHQRQTWLGRQSADHLGLEPGMLWVRVPPELLDDYVLVEQRSARHPVTVEIVGSNPIEDAETARYAIGKAAKLKPSWSVGSTPTRVIETSCVGWALACLGDCNPPAFGHWRFDSVPTHLFFDDPFF